jgi:hypothetical protein
VRPRKVDPTIEQARRIMARNVVPLARARRELVRAMLLLEQHPDYRRTAAAKRITADVCSLAWWLHGCIESVVHGPDGLDAFPDFLAEDSRPGSAEASLARLVRQELDELVKFGRLTRAEADRRAARAPALAVAS